MRHLVKALKNENENYLLIIEEINRANTAAVFGDMFQLLDRDENGESEYKISISDELKEHLDKESVKNLKNNKLYLPSNFYIWATMNNADQGVMPLDTAFKRRWDFEYMPLDLTKEDEEQLQGLKLEWNKLRKNINKKLLSLGINEDKLLGFYFLNSKALENEDNYLKALQNKVLMYLYEDVLRHCRAKVFGEKTFAQIEDIRNIFLNQQEQNQDENT
ncbi:AAA family ATPase [Campylobacter sp. RM5004]|uniref:AAA family ATPase n=1 Tax=Campylobacter sp. RM5004 TaxID=1660078 RepID=UPI0023BAFF71|nr:AAA family ATPase [Campylobacter sp. RM5004]